MDQTSVIRNLAAWIFANPWHPSLTVLYDLCNWGMAGESHKAPLYMYGKERGRGRRTQLKQPDILVRNEDTVIVQLVVEVDFRKKQREGGSAATAGSHWIASYASRR